MTTDLTSARLGDLVTFSSGGVKRTGRVVRRGLGTLTYVVVEIPFYGRVLVNRFNQVHRIRRAEDVCNVHAGPKTL